MPVNLDKPHLWKADVNASVDLYNTWFMQFAPEAFRTARNRTADVVLTDLAHTQHLTDLSPQVLRARPSVLRVLRMCTAPPIAVDRLTGLAGVNRSLVLTLEGTEIAAGRLPPRMPATELDAQLSRMGKVIATLTDDFIFPWVATGVAPTVAQEERAASIVADRLCNTLADPIVRNAQEKRQLALMAAWLLARGYTALPAGTRYTEMAPGTFSFRLNVPVKDAVGKAVNMPVDAVVQPHTASFGDFPLLIEAKSAGDFANTNKRRKEEAQKYAQLRATHGPGVRYILFLCGYFDAGYLGYEAAEGIDWVWEHRPDDMTDLGL